MNVSLPPGLKPLPVPPNYMRPAEQQEVREMSGPKGRPDGDHRSAEQIIEQSRVLSDFMQSLNHYPVSDDLKRQVGDWTHSNPDPDARADAAYDLDKVMRFIDNVDDRTLNHSTERNGRIDGFYEHGYKTQENSEASLLAEFSRKGYDILRNLKT